MPAPAPSPLPSIPPISPHPAGCPPTRPARETGLIQIRRLEVLKASLPRIARFPLKLAASLALAAIVTPASAGTPPSADRIAADWLLAERVASLDPVSASVKTREDAIGGCDGIKDGRWGFHTSEGREPWWQVDLGSAETAVQRIVVWNRPQAPERAARLRILLSDDGRAWRTVYQHDGTVFIGSTDQRPLTVTLETTRARFVRIQLPGTAFLHSKVEVFGPSDPARNLALNRPADQSGVSAWSLNHALPQGPDWRQATERFLAQSRRLEADLRASGTDRADFPNLWSSRRSPTPRVPTQFRPPQTPRPREPRTEP